MQKSRLAMLATCSAIVLPTSTAIAPFAFTTPVQASTFDFSQKFVAPDGAGFENFGISVALDGDYALIGSRWDNDNGFRSGSAYLFDTTSGNLLQKFLAPDGASNAWFGYSVVLNGDYALIGSPGDDDNGIYSGSAYLFDLTSGDLLQKFLTPDGAHGDQLGFSVALDGDYVLIGSPGNNGSGSKSGSAYLFDLSSGDLLQKFIPPNGAGLGLFGLSVALDGDSVLIGSPGDDDNGFSSGSAYLFDLTSGDLLQKFIAPDGTSRDVFGYSIALDGDYALISSRFDSDNGPSSGSVYLFDLASGNFLQKFIAPDGASNDQFGFSVALDEDSALVGSLFDSDNGSGSGSAYLFDLTSGNLLQKFIAPDGAISDLFGISVALDGDLAMIGALQDDDNETDSGSAYLFAREEMEKVPEPSAILGLIAIGTLGILKRFSGQQTQ